jgi:cold-inducible RNA-binding protein
LEFIQRRFDIQKRKDVLAAFSRLDSMATKLYVGNLPFNTTENELQELFSQAGAVQEVMLMQDKFTGKSRGFAFVTMGSDADAQKAIAEINGKTLEGRALTVNEARPREPRPPGGGGGGGYGGDRRREGGGQRRGR